MTKCKVRCANYLCTRMAEVDTKDMSSIVKDPDCGVMLALCERCMVTYEKGRMMDRWRSLDAICDIADSAERTEYIDIANWFRAYFPESRGRTILPEEAFKKYTELRSWHHH